MARREFTRAVKVAVIRRCTVGEPPITYCEGCKMPARKWQIDHITPDGLGGKPTFENAQLLCDICYGVKNPHDTRVIAKAKRREAAHLAIKSTPSRPIKSRGFPPTTKADERKASASTRIPMPPRRNQNACRRFGDG